MGRDLGCREKKTPFKWLGTQALRVGIRLRIPFVKHRGCSTLSFNSWEEEVFRKRKPAQKGNDRIRTQVPCRPRGLGTPPHLHIPTPGQVRALPASGGGVRDAAHLRLLNTEGVPGEERGGASAPVIGALGREGGKGWGARPWEGEPRAPCAPVAAELPSR